MLKSVAVNLNKSSRDFIIIIIIIIIYSFIH